MKLFKCRHCGNVVEKVYDSKVPVVCCGEKMEELVPNTSDGAGEKHVPVALVEGNVLTIHIGEVPHPMVQEHYITHVFVEMGNKVLRASLHAGEEPKAQFVIEDDKGTVKVYEYCNIHGLWMSELEV